MFGLLERLVCDIIPPFFNLAIAMVADFEENVSDTPEHVWTITNYRVASRYSLRLYALTDVTLP